MSRSRIVALSGILVFAAAITIRAKASQDVGAGESPSKSCGRSVLLNFVVNRNGNPVREVPVWQLPDKSAFFFSSGMTIDADGAPNAYNPENTGLDDLSNAGIPGHWDGIVQDQNGDLAVQRADDPYPGYYVSCTSLVDRTKSRLDPRRYVDASRVPYVVLPGDLARQAGARLGDFAVVVNMRDSKWSFAIFADVGTLGEGSIALADNLGIWSDARRGGRGGGLLYLVFPGSGNGQPRSAEEIDTETAKLLKDWGGIEQLTTCATNQEPATAAKAVDTPLRPGPEASPRSN